MVRPNGPDDRRDTTAPGRLEPLIISTRDTHRLAVIVPSRSTRPGRLGRGDRDRHRLGLEIAEAIAVEPALAETQAAPEHFLEHLPLEGADGRVGLGEFVVRAGVLAEDRD